MPKALCVKPPEPSESQSPTPPLVLRHRMSERPPPVKSTGSTAGFSAYPMTPTSSQSGKEIGGSIAFPPAPSKESVAAGRFVFVVDQSATSSPFGCATSEGISYCHVIVEPLYEK